MNYTKAQKEILMRYVVSVLLERLELVEVV